MVPFSIANTNSDTTAMRFVGPFELVGDSVARVNVDGGYWEGGRLHGYVTDRLGNVRGVRSFSGGTEQVTEYYPYGAPSYSVNPTLNPYKYGGKRFDTRNGMNMAHHGARMLLNDLGRFASPDPLAELTPGISPYLYCGADPINRTDPTGLYSYDEAIQASTIYGSNCRIEYDKYFGEYYILPDGIDGFDSDGNSKRIYGSSMLLQKTFYISNNIATMGGTPRSSVDGLLNLAKYSGGYMKYSKFLGLLGTGINVGYSAFQFISYQKAGGDNPAVYGKFITDAAVALAPVIVSIGISIGVVNPITMPIVVLGGLIYSLADMYTDGFNIDYSIKICPIKNR